MLFTTVGGNNHNSAHIIAANGSIIERVTEYKDLGIWLDKIIIFKYHIANLVSKLHQ